MTEEVQTLTIYHFHHAHHANVLFTTLTLFNIMFIKVGAMFAQKSTLTPEMQLVLDQVGSIDEESTQNSTGIIFNSLKPQKSYSTQKKLKTFFQFEPGRLYLAWS